MVPRQNKHDSSHLESDRIIRFILRTRGPELRGEACRNLEDIRGRRMGYLRPADSRGGKLLLGAAGALLKNRYAFLVCERSKVTSWSIERSSPATAVSPMKTLVARSWKAPLSIRAPGSAGASWASHAASSRTCARFRRRNADRRYGLSVQGFGASPSHDDRVFIRDPRGWKAGRDPGLARVRGFLYNRLG